MRAWLLVLLLAPAAQAQINLTLPASHHLSEAPMLAGHVALTPAAWSDPAFTSVTALGITGGNLTVCPLEYDGSGAVPRVLSTLGQSCTGGRTYHHAEVTVAGSSSFRFAGIMPLARQSASQIVVILADSNATVAELLSPDGVGLAAPPAGIRFAPTATRTRITVHADEGTEAYNGTGWGWLSDGPTVSVKAEGGIGGMARPLDATVTPVAAGTPPPVVHPLDLLDLEAQVDPDGREAAANVTNLFLEYGRVPGLSNGALTGALNGTVGARFFHGPAIVQAASFQLRADRRLTGEGAPSAALSADGVSLGNQGARHVPWLPSLLLYTALALVAGVRRRGAVRPGTHRLVWAAAFALSWWIADRFLLADRLGAGALSPGGPYASLAAFGLLLVTASYLAFALPARIILGRIVPRGVLLPAEAGMAVLWALLPALLPASLLALGFAWGRL
ncbi:MAG: hypothetical protein ACYDBQ_11455 [Thermoplasmatota archaeon]